MFTCNQRLHPRESGTKIKGIKKLNKITKKKKIRHTKHNLAQDTEHCSNRSNLAISILPLYFAPLLFATEHTCLIDSVLTHSGSPHPISPIRQRISPIRSAPKNVLPCSTAFHGLVQLSGRANSRYRVANRSVAPSRLHHT